MIFFRGVSPQLKSAIRVIALFSWGGGAAPWAVAVSSDGRQQRLEAEREPPRRWFREVVQAAAADGASLRERERVLAQVKKTAKGVGRGKGKGKEAA